MKVILKENVKSLGNVGEVLNVTPGYARNFLLPRKLAIVADAANTKAVNDFKRALNKKVSVEKAAAEVIKAKINDITITLVKRVGGSGKLFGSITNADIAAELTKSGVVLERRVITVDRAVKQLGTYEVKAKIFPEVEAKFTLKIEIDPNQVEELKVAQKEAAEKKKRQAKAEKDAKAAEELAAQNTTVSMEVEEEVVEQKRERRPEKKKSKRLRM
ncbi:MAG: 50S ribosomal protein L9 [Bacteriovoracaceae bacterium]|nr:50S ribosomal protein L9 [Bacteriovoracaceae bacterium]